MAYPQGINFRATLAYVTDGAADSCELGAASGGVAYPRTTAQGNTVGWEGGGSGNERNRSTTNDNRLAGLHFFNSVTKNFRFDLPAAGKYNIRLAAGDASNNANVGWSLIDNATSLGVLASGTGGAVNSFKDASNVSRTAAAWPGNNVAVAFTFASTICRFRSDPTVAGNSIAHAYVESAEAGAPTGTYAATLAGVAMAASGQNINGGSFSAALQGVTMEATGAAAAAPTGTFAATLGNVTMTASGAQLNAGSFATTLAGAVMAASGTAAPHVTGSYAATLGDVYMSASGFTGDTPPAAKSVAYRWRVMRRGFSQ